MHVPSGDSDFAMIRPFLRYSFDDSTDCDVDSLFMAGHSPEDWTLANPWNATNVPDWVERVLVGHSLPPFEVQRAVKALGGLSNAELRQLTRSELSVRTSSLVAGIIFEALITSLEDFTSSTDSFQGSDSCSSSYGSPPSDGFTSSCWEAPSHSPIDNPASVDTERTAPNAMPKAAHMADRPPSPNQPRRRGGRPKLTTAAPRRNSRSGEGRPKGRLWEFLLRLLQDEEHSPSVIRWEDRENGVFCFVHGKKVAEMWGKVKGKETMTYEKMTRTMRTYKNGAFAPHPRRLVYKFGEKAQWRAYATARGA